MDYKEAIEYLAVYANYDRASDGMVRLPDGRVLHVSDFAAEVCAENERNESETK